MSKHTLVLTALLATLLTPTATLASRTGETEAAGTGIVEGAEESDQAEGAKEVDIYAVPPILDPHYRHRKRGQFEFAPYGGGYLGNTVGQTWVAGGRIYYHINNAIAIGANYGFSRLMTDRSSTFGRSLNTRNMHVTNAEVVISNDAAFRSGKTLIEMDFYLTFGPGAVLINRNWEPAGMIGGGVKIYPGISWLALRIDVNNYLHFTEQPGEDRFDCDVLFLGGVSFLFPTNPSPYESPGNHRTR